MTKLKVEIHSFMQHETVNANKGLSGKQLFSTTPEDSEGTLS